MDEEIGPQLYLATRRDAFIRTLPWFCRLPWSQLWITWAWQAGYEACQDRQLARLKAQLDA